MSAQQTVEQMLREALDSKTEGVTLNISEATLITAMQTFASVKEADNKHSMEVSNAMIDMFTGVVNKAFDTLETIEAKKVEARAVKRGSSIPSGLDDALEDMQEKIDATGVLVANSSDQSDAIVQLLGQMNETLSAMTEKLVALEPAETA